MRFIDKFMRLFRALPIPITIQHVDDHFNDFVVTPRWERHQYPMGDYKYELFIDVKHHGKSFTMCERFIVNRRAYLDSMDCGVVAENMMFKRCSGDVGRLLGEEMFRRLKK